MSKFSIDAFKSDISKRGIMRSNRFELSIDLPPNHYLARTYSGKELSFRCDATQLPGVNLATIEGPYRYGYGPLDKAPYGIVHNDVGATFIVDKDGLIHKFFYDWANVIVNYNSSKSLSAPNPITGAKVYEVGYRSKFECSVNITIYNEQNKPIQTVTLLKAYPSNVSQIDFNWGQLDDLVRLQVSFAYKDYSNTYTRK